MVSDLTADVFELRQDGEPQVITLAQYVPERSSATPGTKAPSPRVSVAGSDLPPPASNRSLVAEQVQRTIALVVDDLGLSWESMRETRRALHTFINERVQPGDLVGNPAH